MTITEILFRNIKDEARQTAYENTPALLRSAFRDAPGLEAVYRGKILETQGPAAVAVGNQTDDLLIMSWTEVAVFQSYLQSSDFTRLKEGLTPFSAGPPDLQLFEAAEATSFQPFLAKSPVIQVFRAASVGADTSTSVANQAWTQLIDAISGAAAARGRQEAIPSFYHAFGILQNEGVFLGCIGWDNIKAAKEAATETKVQESMKALESASTVDGLSIYILELELIAEAH